jgi:4-amino-4-deoxy-L-arabinose transferase-like glycosyltransferase
MAGSAVEAVPHSGLRTAGRWSRLDLAAPLMLLALTWLYTWRLDASRMLSDDEGSYFYALWRIGTGELPYCDFLTPQLPGFLLPGGWLFRLTGPDFVVARLTAVAATLGACVLLWWATRRLFGPAVALVAATLLALHPDVFLAGRVFRADPFMLFLAMLGLALFARAVFPRPEAADPPDRRWLVAAGLVFGLATITKLFGPLLLGGCLLWLLVDAWRRGRPWRVVAGDVLAVGLPCAAVVGLVFGLFAARGCDVYGSVVGHHLKQGAGLGPVAVAAKGLNFYTTFLRYNENAVLFFVAIVAAVAAWRTRERRALLFALLLPTALVFLGLSRELFARHLNFVLPAATVLFTLGLASAGRQLLRPDAFLARWLPVALVAALAGVWFVTDRDMAWQAEDGTQRLADFIQQTTEPGDWVLADNSETNFWGQRRTTFSAASLSAGAAQSGQITWAHIQDELAAGDVQPAQVYVDRTVVAGFEYGQLRYLHDLARFDAWLAEHYDFAGPFQRGIQHIEVYTPKDRPLAVSARFAGGPLLLAAGPSAGETVADSAVDVISSWQADEAIPEELVVTVRLVDAAGVEWAQADDSLMASPNRTTDKWLPGELTSHRFALAVPAGTPPGAYSLRLGLYRRGDPRPLAATNDDGLALGSQVSIGALRVTDGPEVPVRRLPDATPVSVAPVAGLTLVGHGPLPQHPVPAGSVLGLDLWWRAQAVGKDLATRVTLSDPSVGTVAADTVVPLGVPGSPSSRWPTGPLTVRQQLRLPVLANAAGGSYVVGVSLVNADGSPVPDAPQVDLGLVEVAARDLADVLTERPTTAVQLDGTLGEIGTLVGADLPAVAAPGATLRVRLAWQAHVGSVTPYHVTVQLLDAAGRPAAQHDGEPAAGRRPTTGWLPGEYVLDEHRVALPPDLPPGQYTLIAALYDPASLARLPASGSDAIGDAVRIGAVTVQR